MGLPNAGSSGAVSAVAHHVIRRQMLDVSVTGTEADGIAVQRMLTILCRDGLVWALEEAFAHAVPAEDHWTIERLEVDLGSFSPETLERDLMDAVAAAVERVISELLEDLRVPPSRRSGSASPRRDDWIDPGGPARASGLPFGGEPNAAIRRLTDGEAGCQALCGFLATGVLPWWYHLPTGQTLEEAVMRSWDAVGQPADLGPALIEAIALPGARPRLVRQFSASFLEVLLRSLSPAAVEIVRDLVAEIARHPIAPAIRRRLLERVWLTVFAVVALPQSVTVGGLISAWMTATPADAGAEAADREAIAMIARAWPGAAEPSTPLARLFQAGSATAPVRSRGLDTADPSVSRLDLDEGVFVDCAGLVLLHSFLPTLFERLDIASDGVLSRSDDALAVLHFLATGAKPAPEYALVLPKLLCGLPLEEPVGAPVQLTEAAMAEANTLLASVITHWRALGDTSPDALRGTFLTRPGKLSRRGDEDLLQVEESSFDVLLDRLPWSIGAVRLPWMTRLLWVEWHM
jgi:Contractile injection system tape measure protein